MSTSTGRARAPWTVLAAAGALLVVTGLGWWFLAPVQEGIAERSGVAGAQARPAPAAATGTVLPPRPGAPTRLEIPALGVRAGVVPIATSGAELVPPADPGQVGWWAEGAAAGASRGTALLTGHTVHGGGGALDDLEGLQPGDRIVVRAGNQPVVHTVRSVTVHTKGELAERAARLFRQRGPGRLALVTCEDWDGERYLANVVVIAEPCPGC